MKSDWKSYIEEAKEGFDVEFKKAKNDLPKEIWPTYSAFANTYGGTIFLGVTEHTDKTLEVTGVNKPDEVIKTLFDNLNNSQKVSVNLLTNGNVEVINCDGKDVIKIFVPKATRQQMPVYINENPKRGTYVRHHEGDYRADDQTLQRMYSEKGTIARDSQLLEGFDLNDIDMDTFRRYRRNFQARHPEHRLNAHNDVEFLRELGGWKKNRKTAVEGLTLAGLLMFGKGPSIKEQLNHYHLDYIERPAARKEARYLDRVTLDGSWSGNLYDFYLKVYPKLTADIKVQFFLEGDTRPGTTPVHEAIREALVNTLAHADYDGRKSIVVVRRPDMFGFRNPGTMRVSPQQAIDESQPTSDPRNASIHNMFFMVGLSERLGSGVSQIYKNWSSQHWQLPKLHESAQEDQTILELRMIDLVDPETISYLQSLFPEKFPKLDELERTIMIIAKNDEWVNHDRAMQVTNQHGRDATLALQKLEQWKMLEPNGSGKNKFYTLPGTKIMSVDEHFNATNTRTTLGLGDSFVALGNSSVDLGSSSVDLDNSSVDLGDSFKELPLKKCSEESNQRDKNGMLLLDPLEPVPFIDDVTYLIPDIYENLITLAEVTRTSKKCARDKMEKVILDICSGQYVSRLALAEIMSRSPEALRTGYLSSMVKDGKLQFAFPHQPTHEKQGYITTKSIDAKKLDD